MLVMYVCVLCVCMYECIYVHVRMYIIIIIIKILNNIIIYIYGTVSSKITLLEF